MTEVQKTTEIQHVKDWKWKDIDWKKATPADIEKVIQNGGNVNDVAYEGHVYWRDVDYRECTPLSKAVEAKNVDVVRYLLEHNANPNVVLARRNWKYGELSVDDAPIFSGVIKTKNKEIIDLFFEHHVDPYIFDPEQKPRRVLDGYRDGCYANYFDNRKSKYSIYEDHPLYVALETDDLDTLKKMTSAPYEVPDACLKGILVKEDTRAEAERYWVAFQLKKEKEERDKLRAEMRQAVMDKDRVAKFKALIGLRGALDADLSDEAVKELSSDEFNQCMDLISEAIDKRNLSAEKNFPVRHAYATRLLGLRRDYSTATQHHAYAAVEAMRAKVLE